MSAPRRILILTNRVPHPLHDGGALAMHAMITGYQREGWQVGLVAMNTVRHPVPEKTVQEQYGKLSFLRTIPFDNKLRPASMLRNLVFSSLPEHAQRFYSPYFEEALMTTIAEFKPHAIQVESLFLSSYLPAIRGVSKAKLILRMHNVEYQVWNRMAAAAKGWKHRYLFTLAKRMKIWEALCWNAYDLLVPITIEDAEIVKATACNTSIHVAPFGLHISGQDAPVPHEFTSGYHLGAMDWQPNQDAIRWFIKEAWPKVHFAAPAFRFHFAGRHLDAGFCTPLPEGVVNDGEVPDAAAFASGKDILVVPLRAGGGIRVKILEAMAAGKLVISTAIGMQGIRASADVHYIFADTPTGFAEAIQWAALYPASAQEVARAGQSLVRTSYDAGKIMQSLSAAVTSIMKG